MGCGRVGATLALSLESQGHDVAVIDSNAAAFRRLGNSFEGKRVTGLGFDRDTLLEAGFEQGVAVETETGHALALEAVAETAKGRGVAVDDGHVVALTLETERQGRPDPAATHDDEVHAATLHRARPPSRLTSTSRHFAPLCLLDA